MSSSPPPLVWNLRAVILFHFSISFLVLLPSLAVLSVLSFFSCYWLILLTFFSRKLFSIFHQEIFFVCVFGIALVGQLGDGSWSVVYAACCHIYIYI